MAPLSRAGHRAPLVPGRTLFDAADGLELVVPASCRRSGRCHECIVEVTAGGDALVPPTVEEAFLRPGFRLACRAVVERPDVDVEFVILRRRLRIFMPPTGPPLEVDPAVRVIDGRVRLLADDATPGDIPGDDLGAATGRLLGVALDIGTTTVVLELVDLASGEALASAAFENPQRFGGSDVMTRITYDDEHPGELRRALRRALNHELARLYAACGIDRHQVVEVVVVGNTTMRDLAFGLDVTPIGRSPYRSTTETAWRAGEVATSAVERRAHEVGLLVHPRARIWGAPLIACHIGADAAADLVATDGETSLVPRMVVDMGTNTEVILTDGRRTVACSCPAGPAFEGGLIRYGMASSEGAIESVQSVDGEFVVRTIGDVEPQGLCGSGLVDLLAELCRIEVMNAHGVFADGDVEVAVVPDRGITLSRADVSQLAQAKAANAVGMQVLLRKLGLEAADLARLDLVGGFASSLDVRNAIAIGFLPAVPPERVVRHGNASVRGAKALLLSRRARARLADRVARIEHVELEAEPDFFELFVDGCRFEPFPARRAPT
ncbi:MAG: ASKHA domain-containing protein [Candidatus Limnocylindrales bacterium]